jgi:hypothetical protein
VHHVDRVRSLLDSDRLRSIQRQSEVYGGTGF